jgi:hypothetical protein
MAETESIDPRSEAIDVLTDALGWSLTEARWERVERMLDALAAAIEADDSDALWDATGDLEMAGPLMIATRLGQVTPGQPPPERVRDRLNQLVHALSSEASPPTIGEDEDDRSASG